LLAATIGVGVGVSSLPFYTAGLFIASLRQEFGWTRAAASSGNLALSLGIALGVLIVGRLVDRFGARAVIIPSLVLEALAFLVLTHTGRSYPAYVSTLFAMGLLGAGASPLAFTKSINAHFVLARGLALGACLMGTGLAATVAPPLLSRVITDYGWRMGYLVLAVTVLAVTPTAVVLKSSRATVEVEPESVGQSGPVMATARFWMLLLASVLAAAGIAGAVIHLVPILTERGMTPIAAASRASAIGVAVMTGRLVIGAALDRFPAQWIGGLTMTISAAGSLLLVYGGAGGSLPAALMLGAGLGAEMDLISYICVRYFGLRTYGRAYGVVYAATLLAAGAGPLIFGLLAGAAARYDTALWASAAALAASATLLFCLPGIMPPAPILRTGEASG
jgi:predicted MFS family arabinose efflux permease